MVIYNLLKLTLERGKKHQINECIQLTDKSRLIRKYRYICVGSVSENETKREKERMRRKTLTPNKNEASRMLYGQTIDELQCTKN